MAWKICAMIFPLLVTGSRQAASYFNGSCSCLLPLLFYFWSTFLLAYFIFCSPKYNFSSFSFLAFCDFLVRLPLACFLTSFLAYVLLFARLLLVSCCLHLNLIPHLMLCCIVFVMIILILVIMMLCSRVLE